jgi:murein tripeptide amidase MpaA
MAKVMNTTEINSALVNFANTYAGLCNRIELPEPTYENRASHALSIGRNVTDDTPAVLIIGGVHAREWGGPDIVVNFAGDILRAYQAGKGLKYGKKSFSADEIRQIVNTVNVVVFPCVNPDGVEFSHTKNHMWRKNRNPASAKPKKPDTVGVDINRNYDFLWEFRKYFAPAAAQDDSIASDDPAAETFHGIKPFSEPETRNVRWLMEKFPKLALFMDVHSFSGDVLYTWGIDQNQISDPSMNFNNPAYNDKRGIINDLYREYLSPADYTIITDLAQTMADAMKAVRGQPYKPLQSVGLYPTAGASDDYCYSRHLLDPKRPKTFSYTIEFNFGSGNDGFLQTGNPKVLDATIRDVIPGLIALCLSVPKATTHAMAASLAATPAVAGAAGASYRTALGSGVAQLLAAYESVVAVRGEAGDAARKGLLKAIQTAAREAGAD